MSKHIKSTEMVTAIEMEEGEYSFSLINSVTTRKKKVQVRSHYKETLFVLSVLLCNRVHSQRK